MRVHRARCGTPSQTPIGEPSAPCIVESQLWGEDAIQRYKIFQTAKSRRSRAEESHMQIPSLSASYISPLRILIAWNPMINQDVGHFQQKSHALRGKYPMISGKES